MKNQTPGETMIARLLAVAVTARRSVPGVTAVFSVLCPTAAGQPVELRIVLGNLGLVIGLYDPGRPGHGEETAFAQTAAGRLAEIVISGPGALGTLDRATPVIPDRAARLQ